MIYSRTEIFLENCNKFFATSYVMSVKYFIVRDILLEKNIEDFLS